MSFGTILLLVASLWCEVFPLLTLDLLIFGWLSSEEDAVWQDLSLAKSWVSGSPVAA